MTKEHVSCQHSQEGGDAQSSSSSNEKASRSTNLEPAVPVQETADNSSSNTRLRKWLGLDKHLTQASEETRAVSWQEFRSRCEMEDDSAIPRTTPETPRDDEWCDPLNSDGSCHTPRSDDARHADEAVLPPPTRDGQEDHDRSGEVGIPPGG